MDLSRECRAILWELIAAECANLRDPLGDIRRDRVACIVRKRMEVEAPWAAREVEATAAAAGYRQEVNDYIRKVKMPLPIGDPAAEEQGYYRQLVYFIDDVGASHTKQRRDVRKDEIHLVIGFNRKHEQAFAREIAWWERAYQAMERAGLDDAATVAVVIDGLTA